MLRDGEVVGAIVIYRQEVRAFNDREIRIAPRPSSGSRRSVASPRSGCRSTAIDAQMVVVDLDYEPVVLQFAPLTFAKAAESLSSGFEAT
jgi:hypothetical protein